MGYYDDDEAEFWAVIFLILAFLIALFIGVEGN